MNTVDTLNEFKRIQRPILTELAPLAGAIEASEFVGRPASPPPSSIEVLTHFTYRQALADRSIQWSFLATQDPIRLVVTHRIEVAITLTPPHRSPRTPIVLIRQKKSDTLAFDRFPGAPCWNLCVFDFGSSSAPLNHLRFAEYVKQSAQISETSEPVRESLVQKILVILRGHERRLLTIDEAALCAQAMAHALKHLPS